jgi:hypothetical protein
MVQLKHERARISECCAVGGFAQAQKSPDPQAHPPQAAPSLTPHPNQHGGAYSAEWRASCH